MNVTGNDEEFESGDSTYGYLVAKRKLILLCMGGGIYKSWVSSIIDIITNSKHFASKGAFNGDFVYLVSAQLI